MKVGVLTFLAGVAVGAAVFKLCDTVIESIGAKNQVDQNKSQMSGRRQTRSDQAARNPSNPGDRASQSPEPNAEVLLKRIEEVRSSNSLEFSNLKIARLFADIGSLSATETHQLMVKLEEMEEIEDWFDPLEDISGTVALRLIELDGLEAVQALEDNRYPAFMEQIGSDFGHAMISFWTSHDPEAARDWLFSQIKVKPENRGVLSGQVEDSDVLEGFFLNYEDKRPGESMAVVSELAADDTRRELMGYALSARIQLSDEPAHIPGILDEGLEHLESGGFSYLLGNAVEKDWRLAKEWVETMEPHTFTEESVLTVGESMVGDSDFARDEAINWLLDQNLEDRQSRIRRLQILTSDNSSFFLSGATTYFPPNPDFINPVDLVEIPGIPPSPNSPSPSLAEALREAFDDEFDGRFREVIETEIRDLGLEKPSQ